MNRPFIKLWEGLIEPAFDRVSREYHLARTLNIILLLLLVWGIGFEIQLRLSNSLPGAGDLFVLIAIGVLALAYYLNHTGKFQTAAILTLALFITSTFAFAWFQHSRGLENFSILYYLIIAILMSEHFFSMRGYLITVTIIMVGLLGISLLNAGAQTIFLFLFIFAALIGFSSYNRRFIEREQIAMACKLAHEQSLLSLEQRKSAQLGLLDEAGRQVTNSLDQKEILERTLEIIVNKFGFAEATISLLANEDILEVAGSPAHRILAITVGFNKKQDKALSGMWQKPRRLYRAGCISRSLLFFLR